jgi:alpha-glucosidase
MRAFSSRVSWRSVTHSWNLLGSFDTPRIRTVVGDADRQEVAVGLLMTLPGMPMICAGDEIGLTGVNGEDSRTPYPWNRRETWDERTLSRYRELIALRHGHEALRDGGLRWAYVDDDALVFLRETAGERLLVQARRASGTPARLALPGAAEPLYGGPPAVRSNADGTLTLPADGPSFTVWRLA